MINNSKRLIVLRKVLATFLFFSYQSRVYSLETCRLEKNEGWAWASSLQYAFGEDSVLDFEGIHRSLMRQHDKIKRLLKKGLNLNICVAQFSFVVESKEKQGEPRIVDFSSDINVNGEPALAPLAHHVFISGANDPQLEGFKAFEQKQDKTHHLRVQFKITDSSDSNAVARKNLIDRLIFIHPYKYFTNLENVIRRLYERYYGVEDGLLPIMPKLAREWIEKCAAGDFEKCSEWVKRANGPVSFHADLPNVAKESKMVFFTNNEDSEQKLLYYLNDITDSLEGFAQLEQLIENILKYYHSSRLYQMREKKLLEKEIKQLVSKGTSQDVVVRKKCLERLKILSARISEIPHEQCIRDIIKKIEDYCEKQTSMSGHKRYALAELLRYLKDVTQFFDHLVTLDKQLIADKHPTPSEYADLDKGMKTVQEMRGKDVFKIDKLIDDFRLCVAECLSKNSGSYISAVVLNIHSSNDVCYSCGPDLAREPEYPNSFVHYFTKMVGTLNPDHQMPLFRIAYSCERVRDDIRCEMCAFDENYKKVNPQWYTYPDGIAFYQHYLKPQSVHDLKKDQIGESCFVATLPGPKKRIRMKRRVSKTSKVVATSPEAHDFRDANSSSDDDPDANIENLLSYGNANGV